MSLKLKLKTDKYDILQKSYDRLMSEECGSMKNVGTQTIKEEHDSIGMVDQSTSRACRSARKTTTRKRKMSD